MNLCTLHSSYYFTLQFASERQSSQFPNKGKYHLPKPLKMAASQQPNLQFPNLQNIYLF